MKNKKITYGIITLTLLAVLFLFVWSSYRAEVLKNPDKIINLPSQISKECGIQNCHGLDIVCGSDIPEVCDAMYAAGDNCRQFASCQVVGGQCKLEKESGFDSCKSCIEKCELDNTNDQVGFFECESDCAR